MSAKGVNSPGIKQLLEAEARAAELVKQARNNKVRRLKQAQDDAVAEINNFKAQKEAEFKNRLTQNSSSGDDQSAKIDLDTKQKLAALETSVAKSKETVIKMLLDITCKVEPRVHINYKA